MSRGAQVLAVLSAAAGTALLAGAFVLMARADAPAWAMLLWGAIALVAVTGFLVRFRPRRVGEAVALGLGIAVAQTVALEAVLVALGGGAPAATSVFRHLVGLGVLDVLTLVAATLAGQWFPQRPPSR